MSLPGYLSIGLLGCLLMGPFMGGSPPIDCPSGSPFVFNDRSYCYVPVKRSWDDAKVWCSRRWGKLASFDCNPMDLKVKHYLLKVSVQYFAKDVWITQAINNQEIAEYCLAVNKNEHFRKCEINSCFSQLPFLCEKPVPHI